MVSLTQVVVNATVDIPLFATRANTYPLQLYHSPRAKILAFKEKCDCVYSVNLK